MMFCVPFLYYRFVANPSLWQRIFCRQEPPSESRSSWTGRDPDLVSELTQHSGQLFPRGKHCIIRCNSDTHEFGSPSLRHTSTASSTVIDRESVVLGEKRKSVVCGGFYKKKK